MDDEEDCVFFGTPLPEMEDEATLKKKAAKELQVRDEKGRQRFHGAFTGGFSAGYFNTVGTKEGWAPSTFISSRSKTADRIEQNPEDFMDDEDFGEFGIATRKIHTTSNFEDSTFINAHKRKVFDADNIIPGEAPLKDIVQPVRESIGILILKKLGWRHGQGIGPRVKKYSACTKMYGCSPFPETVILEDDDPMAAAFTFAPEDAEDMSYKSKDNYFGLGYTGLSKQSVLSASIDPFSPTTTKSWLAKDKKKLKISGQAFGVGAFEDDDDDIYSKDDISQYDFSEVALKGSVESKSTKLPKPENCQSILDGFHLASQPSLIKNHYPRPTLPHNFKPIHLKSITSVYQNVNHSKSRHALSASDRSILLGERKFQKALLNEQEKSDLEPIPSTSSSLSSTASLSFLPFPNDLSKQQRYEEYLRLKGTGDVSKLVQPSSMTEWEKQQEMEEFAKASVLFKPLSNALSSRFESRSQLSVEHEVMSALEKIKKEKTRKQVAVKKMLVGSSNRKTFEWHPVALLCKRMNVPNPYPNSSSSETQNTRAKSMFDHLTFKSEKLENSGEKNSSVPPVSENIENNKEESFKNLPEKIQEVPYAPIPSKKNETMPPADKKPPMDFFRDIFENTSSEDEAEDKQHEADDSHLREESPSLKNADECADDVVSMPCSADGKIENELNQKRVHNISNTQSSSANKKVGFGVFANLDLDALNQKKASEKSSPSDVSKSNSEVTSDINSASNLKDSNCADKSSESNLYGPELPPNFSIAAIAAQVSYNVSLKKQTKTKSSHKHKQHKHKHKKKKKKSSKRSSSSSESTEDELDDIPPSLIIEKMKKLQKRKS